MQEPILSVKTTTSTSTIMKLNSTYSANPQHPHDALNLREIIEETGGINPSILLAVEMNEMFYSHDYKGLSPVVRMVQVWPNTCNSHGPSLALHLTPQQGQKSNNWLINVA